ncbi:MAG: hypothetical protein WBO70_01155 [Erysipelotrichaceae bacterium]
MSKNNRATYGITIIITSFVLLVLVIFSVLSYSSANSDKKLNDKNIERFNIYTKATNKINIYLKEIDYLLLENYNKGINYQEVMNIISKLEYVDNIDDDLFLINIRERINENQYLDVLIKLNDPKNNDNFYEIKKHKVIIQKDWQASDNLPVYQ